MNRASKIIVILASVALILLTIAAEEIAARRILRVSFIDVGQGESILIQDASGFDVLIDGGFRSAGETLLPFLRDHGVTDIEVMVATHGHSDHIGGLIGVLRYYDIPVETVLYNGYADDSSSWSNFFEAVENHGATLKIAQYPDVYRWGSTTAYILNPVPGVSYTGENSASIVVLLVHKGVGFLFTGDITSAIEEEILIRGVPVDVEILKVAHHGDKYSSSDNFLAAVSPSEAVIVGGNIEEDKPSDVVIEKLRTVGARVWQTLEQGTVVVISDGSSYRVFVE